MTVFDAAACRREGKSRVPPEPSSTTTASNKFYTVANAMLMHYSPLCFGHNASREFRFAKTKKSLAFKMVLGGYLYFSYLAFAPPLRSKQPWKYTTREMDSVVSWDQFKTKFEADNEELGTFRRTLRAKDLSLLRDPLIWFFLKYYSLIFRNKGVFSLNIP